MQSTIEPVESVEENDAPDDSPAGVASRADVDELCARAQSEMRSVLGPIDSGPPVGYWAYIVDPDGHNLEVSYGQEVGLTVEQSQ